MRMIKSRLRGTYTYVHTYKHTCIYIDICTHMHRDTDVHVYAPCSCTHTYTHTCREVGRIITLVAVLKHHKEKQLGKENISYNLQVRVHSKGNPQDSNLKVGTKARS